jgi:monoterpene epsilon-lactone hydrolase
LSPDLATQIEQQERVFAPLITSPDGLNFSRDEVGGLPVEWTEPTAGISDPNRVVLYLHGGGYSNGCAAWARRGTARLAQGLGCRVIAPDYRLAPRFGFPAAHEDVLAVYESLLDDLNFSASNVIVAGDSAGGALAVTLCADARDKRLPLPACAITNSLWADIAMNTPSLDDPLRNSFDIRKDMVAQLAETLLAPGDIDPMDPRHSPVYRDLHGLPPLLIQAAGRDVCHDDSVRLAASARAAGVSVTITEYADVEHIWILNGPWRIAYPEPNSEDKRIQWIDCGEEAPQAVTAIEEMVTFARQQTLVASD